MILAILIIAGLILLIILWKLIKPYTIKYDTTLLLTGGLGSGKTLTAVKTATILIRKIRFSWSIHNWWEQKILNKRIELKNKKRAKKGLESLPLYAKRPKPQLYSNMPIYFKPHFWTRRENREWSVKIQKSHLTLHRIIIENSVVLLDELPQLVNQYNWDNPLIQNNVNEWITLFRHYYGGYLIMTAQSTSDIVAQIRRKGNMAIWCYDFNKRFFGLAYTIRMCDMMLNDDITSTSSTFAEENTKLHWALFPPKDTYDSRCYSNRVKNALIQSTKLKRFNSLKTNDILRFMDYNSPLDDNTTQAVKKRQYEQLKEQDK